MFLVRYFLLAFLLLMTLTFLDDQASFNLNGQCHSYLRNGIIMSSPNMSYWLEFPGFEDSGIFYVETAFTGHRSSAAGLNFIRNLFAIIALFPQSQLLLPTNFGTQSCSMISLVKIGNRYLHSLQSQNQIGW